MSRLLIMVIMGMALASAALAQQPPRPVPGDGPNCSPVSELKADAAVTRIMPDGDGDWWVLVRFTSTGRQQVGFISRTTGKFCVLAEGRTHPEA